MSKESRSQNFVAIQHPMRFIVSRLFIMLGTFHISAEEGVEQ